MPRTPSTTDQIRAFEENAVKTFAQFATEDGLNESGLKDNLRRVGITATIAATCDNLTITANIPEHPGLKTGEVAEDLTDAAKQSRAEAYLKARKAAVWTAVKGMVGSSLKAEQAIKALRDLGYSDVSLPSTKATVRAEIARGRNEGYDEVSFTLDGEHTVDEVTEALMAAAKLNPAEALIVSTFPGAVLASSRLQVRNVQVDAKLTWPAKSEFSA